MSQSKQWLRRMQTEGASTRPHIITYVLGDEAAAEDAKSKSPFETPEDSERQLEDMRQKGTTTLFHYTQAARAWGSKAELEAMDRIHWRMREDGHVPDYPMLVRCCLLASRKNKRKKGHITDTRQRAEAYLSAMERQQQQHPQTFSKEEMQCAFAIVMYLCKVDKHHDRAAHWFTRMGIQGIEPGIDIDIVAHELGWGEIVQQQEKKAKQRGDAQQVKQESHVNGEKPNNSNRNADGVKADGVMGMMPSSATVNGEEASWWTRYYVAER